MKVENMTSSRGNKIANQFIISGKESIEVDTCIGVLPENQYFEIFQSYESVIAKKMGCKITLDRDKWDYSVTTGKYRNQFLGETKKETQSKLDSGEYQLVDLN